MDNALAVKEYLVAEFLPDVPADQLADDYDLIASGVVDSLGLLRLISWLETRFEVPIDDVEISEKDFVTVTAICEFVAREARPSASVSEESLKEAS